MKEDGTPVGGDNSYLEICLLELSGVVSHTRTCQIVVCFEFGFGVFKSFTWKSSHTKICLLLQNQKSSETV